MTIKNNQSSLKSFSVFVGDFCFPHQLHGVHQRGKVWVGLVFLDDRRSQRFPRALDEHLREEAQVFLCFQENGGGFRRRFCTCGRSTDRSWTFFSSLRPQNNT